MKRRIGWLLVLGLAATAAGCAKPPRVEVNPADRTAGRQLYQSDHAFLYASSESAAMQAASDLATVAKDYQKATGHAPAGKGLVIVTDENDPPYITDRARMIELIQRHETQRNFGPAKPLSDEVLRKVEQKVGAAELEKILLSRCASMTTAEAVRQWRLEGRPAATASWVLAVPTGELVQHVMHVLTQKRLEDSDMSAGEKAVARGMLSLLEGKFRRQATVDRQVGLFCMLTWSDPALDQAARKVTFQRYQKRRGQAVVAELGLPATQPATSQPSPAPRSQP